MFVASLICDPARLVLDRAAVEALRDAWGGGDARWLEPGVAAEFDLRAIPGNRWEVWDDLQALGIDLVVQRAEGRRKRVLLADMDSTMIEQECIDELADLADMGERVAAITAAAMAGTIDFEPALHARVALLTGLPEQAIARVLAERITHRAGGRTLVATMRANGGYAALVSGGFTAFTGPVASAIGFDMHRANVLEVVEGRLTGRVDGPVLGRAAKVATLEDIVARLGITAADVLAVGDGANDLGMLAAAGCGVALHAKPAVAAACEVRILHGDLTSLLYLQGYRKEEFRTQ